METLLPPRRYEEQLVKFKRKGDHIYEELGPWAADYFILESIKALSESCHDEPRLLGLQDEEKKRLLQVLSQIPPTMSNSILPLEENMRVSAKVKTLISFLADQDPEKCAGLVFVKQRATVSVLNTLLSRHPQTKNHFRCATFVGLSNSAKRRYSIAELLDLRAQREALSELRAKVKNLIIATDVLEEGIDVTACNLVVCFDVPSNLKSFLQRRGRARQEQSTFALLLAERDGQTEDNLPHWQQLESEMIQLYQDETRLLPNVQAEEELEEDVEFELNVPSTGAKLTADDTMGHLYHFCALLPPHPYVDLRPAFTVTQDPHTKLFIANVTLPNCINAAARQTNGCEAWKTRKAARKDAAFQAYKALLGAGLLNDHLLPHTHEKAFAVDRSDDLPAVVEVSRRFDPWSILAEAWLSPDVHRTDIIVQREGSTNGQEDLEFSLITPSKIPCMEPMKMYWDKYTTFTIILGSSNKIALPEAETLDAMRKTTNLIQRSVHSDHNPDYGDDFIALFTPKIETGDVAKWLESNQGRNSAVDYFMAQPSISRWGFVRTRLSLGRPYVFQRWCVSDMSPQGEIMEVECVRLPKRRNFLHKATLAKGLHSATTTEAAELLPAERFRVHEATIDTLPYEQARFSLFIPGILQHVEVYLVAQKLCKSLLRTVPFTSVGLVVTALSCPSAQWITNYQRLELVGDSVLKYVVSRQLFLDHPGWHEGYLSQARANITSNNSLASAALRIGLDAFTMTERGRAGSKRYPRISDVPGDSSLSDRRSLSSKTLADVVEALIGAAYVEGEFDLAGCCINAFLPNIHLLRPPRGEFEAPRYGDGDSAVVLTNFIVKAEDIIGYKFGNKRLLLESLTHPTCERDIHTESYQRLEFLGDAVLDMLVVSLLAKQDVSQGEMTRIKAALVNAHLLGFFCLGLCTDEDVIDIKEERPRGREGLGVFEIKAHREQRHLWKYMRFHNQEVAMARDRSLARYDQLRVDIRNAIATGVVYPWVLLTRLNPEKFLSDIIESIIGAIFIDSQGDLLMCHHFIEHIGLSQYLRRICAERIDVEHPRNALERKTGPEAVKYIVSCEGAGLVQLFRCTLYLGGELLAQADGCLTTEEAVAMAAEIANNVIVERGHSTA